MIKAVKINKYKFCTQGGITIADNGMAIQQASLGNCIYFIGVDGKLYRIVKNVEAGEPYVMQGEQVVYSSPTVIPGLASMAILPTLQGSSTMYPGFNCFELLASNGYKNRYKYPVLYKKNSASAITVGNLFFDFEIMPPSPQNGNSGGYKETFRYITESCNGEMGFVSPSGILGGVGGTKNAGLTLTNGNIHA